MKRARDVSYDIKHIIDGSEKKHNTYGGVRPNARTFYKTVRSDTIHERA